MKLNKLLLVGMILLAIISIGAVSAAEMTANDTAVTDNGGSAIESSEDEINADGGNLAVSNDANGGENSNLCATDDEVLKEGSVDPTYTYNIDLPKSGTVYEVQWGQPIPITADFGDATGSVLITFNNVDYDTIPLVDGKFAYNFTKYTAISNNRVLKITYSGDDYYKSINFQEKVNVKMDNVKATGANYGLSAFIDVDLFEATGNVTFTLNGVTFNGILEDGKFTQEFTNYKLGSNSVSFTYLGDDKYNTITKSYSFTATANIDAPTIYNYQPAIITAYMGGATGNVTFKFNGDTQTVDIVNGIATYEAKDYVIGENKNTVTVEYSGDDTFNSFSTTKKFTVLDKENATILSSIYPVAGKDTVLICVPFGTGNVTAIINGKEEILELVDGVAYYDIPEGVEITEINASYAGNARLNPGNASGFKYLNNVVTQDNYMYYFSQPDSGKVFAFIPDGTTLDFQGSIINPDQLNKVFFDVSKPLNIISSTNDAYIDLNTTAGSLLGENPGNRFTISRGGSWSNVTGIYFHNTQLWVFNTTHVVLDRVSNVIEDQRVGSGVGATSIRANSTWVTVKNGYFYTRNNGGSSSLVMAWADYCTFDNNTIVVEGEVGNMIYLTTYNVDIPRGVLANVYNNITNNRILAHDKTPAGICWGLVISGANNYVADNYIDYGGIGINQQWGQGDFINNTYTRNVLVGGASASFLPTSTVYNNNIEGTATTGADTLFFNNTVGKALTVSAGAEAYDNTAGGLTLSGAGAIVHDNIIDGATTISQGSMEIYNNTFLGDNAIKFSAANTKNNNFYNNSVVGYIEFGNKNAIGNNIVNNTIITSKNYAVDLKTYTGTGTNVVDNILYSAKGMGNAAVNHKEDATLTIDNYPVENADIVIETEPIKVGQDAVFNISTNVTSIAQAKVVINGRDYTVNLTDGKGTLTVSGLEAKDYDVTVTSLDEMYGAENTTTLSVTKYDCPEIVVDAPEKTQWIDSDITVTIEDATGKVTLSINGTDVSAYLIGGVAVLEVPDLAAGEYNFTIAYEGDYMYLGNTTKGTLKVNRNREVFFIVSDLTVDKIADKFQATLTDYIGQGIEGVNLTLAVNGEDIVAATDENGTATFDIALTMGSYPVTVSFNGNDDYDANSADATIDVVDKTSITIVSIDGADFAITAVLKDVNGKPIANAAVSYTINNGEKVNTTTNDKGEFTATVEDNSLITLIFEGNEFAEASNATITLKNIKPVQKATMIEVPSTMKKTAVDYNAGEKGTMFYFYLKDADGKALANKGIKIGIFDKIYTVKTDSNGRGGLQINIANANYYTYALSFLGDDDYKASFAVCSLQIVKKSVTITPAKTSYSFKASAKTKTVTATLKSTNSYIPKGKQVTLTVAGKTFKATIGDKGQINFNIGSITKKGTYKVAIKFAGTNTYAAANSKTITIKIA